MTTSNPIRKLIPGILRALWLGIIIGVILGLVFCSLHAYNSGYTSNKAYNIILLNLKTFINYYVLASVVGLFAIMILERLFRWIFHGRYRALYKYGTAGLLSLIVILLLSQFLIYLYPEIIFLLKSSPFAGVLHKLTDSWDETKRIFIYVSAGIGLVFFIFSTYALSKSKIVLKFVDYVQSLSLNIDLRDSRSLPIKPVAALLLAAVILLNIFMYTQKRLNARTGPNILLISIDTLRADHLGSYGHRIPTNPNIDRIAAKGILFENAYAQAPWTYPSMASMHTSVYPSQLNISELSTVLNQRFMTLAEHMKNNFYNTSAVIANRIVNKNRGFNQGFDIYDEDPIGEVTDVTSHKVSDRAIEYLNRSNGHKFFMWLHYMDPHDAYVRHPEYNYSKGYGGALTNHLSIGDLNKQNEHLSDSDLKYIRDIYDEEISYMDYQVGRVFDELDKLGLSENTVIFITADHGEEFLERGKFGHTNTLNQELIHVPLIIYVPSEKELGAKRVKSAVEVRSIAKTILDISGINNSRILGENLLITAENDDDKSYAFSQKLREGNEQIEAIIKGKWKLMKNIDLDSYELYDLENDPGERNNLFDSEDVDTDIIRDLIVRSSKIEKGTVYEPVEIDLNENEIAKLKALGYIQ